MLIYDNEFQFDQASSSS